MTWCEVCGDHHPPKVVPRGSLKPGSRVEVDCVGQQIVEEGQFSCTCGPCPVHGVFTSNQVTAKMTGQRVGGRGAPEPPDLKNLIPHMTDKDREMLVVGLGVEWQGLVDTTCSWCGERYRWPGGESGKVARGQGAIERRHHCPACGADSTLFGERE